MKEFRRLDLNTEERGVSISKLMARAGTALAKEARDMGDSVLILCGKGHNGGDGYAAAGVLARWGIPVDVVAVEPAEGISKEYARLLDPAILHKWGPRRPWNADVIVDCLLGSGIQGAPRKPYDQAIRWINKHDNVLACDVPSGMGSNLVVQPRRTVTFHAPKIGMEGISGDVVVADIGIRKTDLVGKGDLDAAWIQKDKAHKGDHGRVLVIGGGPYHGAPHYAGMGAVRTGADLVHVATTRSAAAIIASWGPDLLVHGYGNTETLDMDSLDAILARAVDADALVLGPGLGNATDLVEAILDGTTQPCVLDADGLRVTPAILARHKDRLVLTPHAGEFKRLTGRAATAANAARFAAQHGVVLLKGVVDTITDGETTRKCDRGHPCMTVGGSGDVLAGIVGAIMARGADPLDAASAGAYISGRAGEIAGAWKGQGATATDIHEAIPGIIQEMD